VLARRIRNFYSDICADMTRHVYPTSVLLGDYACAAAGFFPTAAILTTSSVGAVAGIVLGGFAILFAVFGVRTAFRHGTQIEATETALSTSGMRRISISWGELERLKLAYYSTRRDRRDGWLQLELRAGSSTLRFDSRIEGFTDLIQASARAAELRGLSLSPATVTNLQALGVSVRTAKTDFQDRAGEAA
jgi:hypothetical protein